MAASSAVPAPIQTFLNTLHPEKGISSENTGKSVVYSSQGGSISVTVGSYQDVHVGVPNGSLSGMDSIQAALSALADTLKGYNSLWINFAMPMQPSYFAALPGSFIIGTQNCNLIRDEQQKKIRVWRWLNPSEECTIPPGATHNIGATALLVDTKAQKVLLVQNVMRPLAWNLPGGSYSTEDDGKSSKTAKRELLEETGLDPLLFNDANPQLVGQMEFPGNQFAPAVNQIWLIERSNICTHRLKPPPKEIKSATWFPIQQVLDCKGTLKKLSVGREITAVLASYIDSTSMRVVEDKGWMTTYASTTGK